MIRTFLMEWAVLSRITAQLAATILFEFWTRPLTIMIIRFADGTGVQKSSNLPNHFFVSFTEVGSCDSYDQYAYDHNNCNAFNRPPVLPDQDSDYLQGKNIWNKTKNENSISVIETDYDNYALVSFCEDIDDDSHKETLYILVRSQSCWANLNKGRCQYGNNLMGSCRTLCFVKLKFIEVHSETGNKPRCILDT